MRPPPRWLYIGSQIIFPIVMFISWTLAERRADHWRKEYAEMIALTNKCIRIAEDNQHKAEKAIELLRECKEAP